jgi:hypothetical protein
MTHRGGQSEHNTIQRLSFEIPVLASSTSSSHHSNPKRQAIFMDLFWTRTQRDFLIRELRYREMGLMPPLFEIYRPCLAVSRLSLLNPAATRGNGHRRTPPHPPARPMSNKAAVNVKTHSSHPPILPVSRGHQLKQTPVATRSLNQRKGNSRV